MQLAGIYMQFSRYILSGIALLILVMCSAALLRYRQKPKTAAVLKNLLNGDLIPVSQYETSVGSNKKCDAVLAYDTVSRSHAVLALRTDGWFVYDTRSKTGIEVNGLRVDKKAVIYDGDTVSFGGIPFSFSTEIPDELSKKPGRPASQSMLLQSVYFMLLTIFQIFAAGAVIVGENNSLVTGNIFVFAGLILSEWIFFLTGSVFFRIRHFEPEVTAFLLSTLGLGAVAAESPSNALKQFLTLLAGEVIFFIAIGFLRNIEHVKPMRWVAAFGSVGLLGLTLVLAKAVNGALNWISFGGVSFQPSEFVKVAFIFVGAVTLERLQSTQSLTKYMFFAGACVGELFLMYDFGAALIFFFTFIIIAFMRSGDVRTLILICFGALLGGGMILYFRPYVADRFATYRHIWEFMNDGGYQQTRTLIYSSSGGLFGLGLGQGKLRYVFAAEEDLAFGVIFEEFGMIIAFAAPLVLAVLAVYAIRCAKCSRSSFHSIAAVASGGLLVFQACLNIFGVTDLLPMTGVTLPFVSRGGSSMICCWALLAMIKSADRRTYTEINPESGVRSE